MHYFKYVIFGLVVVLLNGCADSNQIIRLNSVNNTKLDRNGAVYVSLPKDGVYENTIYHGSGMNTATIIQTAFAKRVRDVEVGHNIENFKEALASAKKAQAKYLVYVTILHWEDRATEWSGKPDRVEIKMEIINVSDGKTIGGTIIKGKSGLATFGGDHPEDLLPKPVEEFVSSLY